MRWAIVKAAGATPDMEKLAAEITARAQRGDLARCAACAATMCWVTHGKNDTLVPESMSAPRLRCDRALPEASSMTPALRRRRCIPHLKPTSVLAEIA
ncbi:MAG: hypothetical protein IPK54_07955 [Dokdonella sp.]|uniref:hypothetical protein n=1 Tax=Dokdonella sp. TaxID=2291710 RepID=UPI0025C41649|nr:hypothetical protein [Dokdonella sp.]MBK8123473.1 hypothetical protein [Dokdonella sp.]